jgi:hypothetical protein
MGADAVVDLHRERLPGFVRTEHRASGMAVRAVDEEGRLELKTRWFSGQIGQVAVIMLVVAGLELCVDLLSLLAPRSIGIVLNVIGCLFFVGLAAGLAFWKWPQLARPTAFCFLAKAVATVVGMFGTVAGSAILGLAVAGAVPGTAERVPSQVAVVGGLSAAAVLVFGILISASLCVFFLYLGRRAWRIDQEYRSLAGLALALTKIPASRLWVGRLAWAAACFYSLVLTGTSAFDVYGSVVELLAIPKTPALITSPSGVQLTLNSAEWNSHARRLANDPDPAARSPSEAVRLAEQAVAAEPRNAGYLITLGIARYRAGDFAGAIEALDRGVDRQEHRGHAAFFLAMAHARLGRHPEAQDWYQKADEWTRAKQPKDAELRRFRGEAAAVLDVADDKPAEVRPAAPDAPVAKDAAPRAEPRS